MPRMKIVIRHHLPQSEALRRIRDHLGGLKRQFADRMQDLREYWRGNVCKFSLSIMGFAVSGTLTVGSTHVALQGNLPLVLIPFRAKLRQ